MAKKAYKNATYQARVEKGLCVGCGKVRMKSGRIRCKPCREVATKKINLGESSLRGAHRKSGWCVYCKESRLPNLPTCFLHTFGEPERNADIVEKLERNPGRFKKAYGWNLRDD